MVHCHNHTACPRPEECPEDYFEQKPVLKEIYRQFYRQISTYVTGEEDSLVVELGAGPWGVKAVIPHCLQTGLSPAPWIDRVENAYCLSFAAGTVSDLILFDVFHHLEYPGTALQEFYRVLRPGGRVIIFEPCVSLLGVVVYGFFHHEPMALNQPIAWQAPKDRDAGDLPYYAASGNAWRLFIRDKGAAVKDSWTLLACKRIAAIAYAASGGYTRPQLYPDFILPAMRVLDAVCQMAPSLFATRLLVVLEK